jgi:gluconolactonase
MDDYEIIDPRFSRLVLINCRVEKLFTGSIWAEGPCWFADGGFLVWSDIPNDRMLRWVEGLGVTEFRRPANFTNGHTRDRQGRLVSCEHGARRVSRTEWDGTVTTLADRYQGKRLNSPNDVVVKSDGTVWFTDPTYGIDGNFEGYAAESEIGSSNVYRFDPASATLHVVADDFVQPNGLAFSPDERLLYVSDTGLTHVPDGGPKHIRAFDVDDGNRLANGRLFADCNAGIFDGFRLDQEGNLWSSAGDGVHCFAPDGTLLGKIRVPEKVANCCVGGPKRNRLFITATTSLYAVYLNAHGVQSP